MLLHCGIVVVICLVSVVIRLFLVLDCVAVACHRLLLDCVPVAGLKLPNACGSSLVSSYPKLDFARLMFFSDGLTDCMLLFTSPCCWLPLVKAHLLTNLPRSATFQPKKKENIEFTKCIFSTESYLQSLRKKEMRMRWRCMIEKEVFPPS